MTSAVRTFALAAICSLGFASVAHADTFLLTDFTFASGATAVGTVNINTTTGLFTGADIAYTLGGNSLLFTTITLQSGQFSGLYIAELFDSAGNEFDFNLQPVSLIGYTGGPVCSFSNVCPGGDEGAVFTASVFEGDEFASGSLTDVSLPIRQTPEPGSLVLLGTGLLGGFVAARRKLLGR